jgi:predicted lipoprotein with Yx(FWY)xxD motif
MRNKWLASAGLAAAALIVAACGSSSPGAGGASSTSSSASAPASSSSSGTTLKTAKIGGATVLTNAGGFTLYWFAPDTTSKSNCNGSCAQIWPPVKGPATGVTGTLGTITRSDGSVQATYNGHPLYTYTADTAPGQANGNGINASGGVWHEVTTSGSAAPAASPTSTHTGYGY